MKLHLLPSAVAAILGLSAMASHGQLLLSDNFTVTSALSGSDLATAEAAANNNLAARQSGTDAGSAYTYGGSGGYNVQTGNKATSFYPGPATNTDGNYLLLYRTGMQNNLALNYDLAGNHAISISFNLYLPSSGWGAFTLSNTLGGGTINAAYPAATTDLFGFLATAGTTNNFQAFNASATQYVTKTAFTSYASSLWTLVLSDVVDGAAGTGSPFGGNGTYVSLYYANTLIESRALTTQFGNSTLYLGFYGQLSGGAVGIDNLSVTAVPEPASVGAIVAIGMGLVVIAARRRRAERLSR